ncbi:hypothetical protein GCM10010495_38520 [Kitasatospora herbaricolor]|uniref:LysE family transporter n=1 Tax=Kitasatospora herbaricolor TaxID=68217 RepID=UPI00174B06DC|nr:LysE family transporter [Kitasatospora herbaricolor]MDQ0306856.1 arginine exporter protein ArgO [Kitasatospora herbaricolor]GGV19623.1 hypothetical protein GCM10010495_38520 [Kitasatospora herbaricolor]
MTESLVLMDTSLVRPLLAGGAAGLGVALPLGAVGVLLLEEGRRGWRAAAGAAAAVALADLLYAALAVSVGTRVSALLAGWEVWTRTASAALLGAIAVRGLLALLRPRERPHERPRERPCQSPRARPGASAEEGAGGVTGADDGGPRAGGAGRAFVRFLLLTLVNPATALYFVALVSAGGAGGPGGGGATPGALAGAAFAGGVFVASLAWQQVLAGLGALAGARLTGPVARTLTYGAGYGLVAYYAVRLALPA